MSFIDTIKGRAAIQKVAEREGKSYAEIEAAIQEAINLAWEDFSSREYQNMLFPKGKPTAAEYVGRIGRHITLETLEYECSVVVKHFCNATVSNFE